MSSILKLLVVLCAAVISAASLYITVLFWVWVSEQVENTMLDKYLNYFINEKWSGFYD